jgi:hypothetical protein
MYLSVVARPPSYRFLVLATDGPRKAAASPWSCRGTVAGNRYTSIASPGRGQEASNLQDRLVARWRIHCHSGWWCRRGIYHHVTGDVAGGHCDQGARPEGDWPYDITQFTQKPLANAYRDALKDRAVSYRQVAQTLSRMKGCLAVPGAQMLTPGTASSARSEQLMYQRIRHSIAQPVASTLVGLSLVTSGVHPLTACTPATFPPDSTPWVTAQAVIDESANGKHVRISHGRTLTIGLGTTAAAQVMSGLVGRTTPRA